MASPDNRCKGVVYHTLLEVVRVRCGEVVAASVVEHTDGALREALRYGSIVRGGWYPAAWYRALHRSAAQVTKEQRLAFIIGRESTLADFKTGFMRLVLKVVSPSFVLSMGSQVFNRYFEHGTLKIEPGTCSAVVTWTDVPGFDANLWEDVLGGCVGALMAGGAQNVSARRLSGGRDGDQGSVVELTWQ